MIEDMIEKISERKPKRILLQLPEGLKTRSLEIVTAIEKKGIAVILSAEPCYGACDLRDDEAEQMHCDLLVHVGHEKFFKDFDTKVPVLYYPWKTDVEIKGIDFSIIEEERIGLLTSIQYEDLLDSVVSALKEIGKKPVIGGNILGCFTENAERIKDGVDCFLFVGSGRFHPLGIKGKKTYVLDLERKGVEPADFSLLEKKRYARIAKAIEAKSFGILVSSKKGQYDLDQALKTKKHLEKKDKKAFILIMDEVSNEKLEGIRVDAFINTACPRIADDIRKTIINASDLKEVFE